MIRKCLSLLFVFIATDRWGSIGCASAFQIRSYSSSGLINRALANCQPQRQPPLPFNPHPHHVPTSRNPTTTTTASSTALFMYNLPPSPGGGNNNDNPLGSILSGALTIGAIILFFASPLGGIFFAITNSLFLLALLTPVVLIVGFQVWRSLNTMQGTCPSCGAPNQVVLKDPNQVSLCLNCGALLRSSLDQQSIELTNDPSRMEQPGSSSIFDQLFDNGTNDNLSSPSGRPGTTTQRKTTVSKREQVIIDVQVDNED